MTKTQTRSTLLAFSIVAIVAAVASPSFAAPQDDVFKRAGENKTEATDKAATESSAQTETPATSVTKDSDAKIEQQSDGWFTVVDDSALVEVRMPAKPTYKEITFSPIAGRSAVVNHLYNTTSKGSSIDYSWMDLHDAPTGKQLTKALDGAVKGAVVNVFGQLDAMTKIKADKVPGREFDFTFPIRTPDGKTHMLAGKSRIYIQGNRQYQLNVISPQGKADNDMITKLFDSLIIKKAQE